MKGFSFKRDSQGLRSNFEIGGGGGLTKYWGSKIHFFLLNLYNFKNIGGTHAPLCPPPPYSAVPDSCD